MVNEVNSIVYNTLVSERAIHLPEIGTLSVVRCSASMTSSSVVVPPLYRVEFSSHAKATSIIDAIAVAGNVDIDKAEDIYCRWLGKVKNDSVLQIDGVGTLRGKSFVADDGFVALFNPTNKPVRIKYKHSKAISAALATTFIGVVGVLGVAAWFFYKDAQIETEEVTLDHIVNITEGQDVSTIYVSDVTDICVTEEVVAVEEVEGDPIAVAEDWTTRDDIHHWVVVGSYSTMENADVAVAGIAKQYAEIKCKVLPLGKMFAVAIFGGNDLSECAEYKQKYSNEFKQAWIFTPKEYR